MIGLLQRVSEGRVVVDGHCVGEIAQGLVVLIGVQKTDDESSAERLLERLLGYRVFPDKTGRMNLSLRDIDGGLLLVPQFTLAANTQKGTRAGFSSAADPVLGARLFEHLLSHAERTHKRVACGEFGADMQVSLTNDGPVTFWLES
ncbi:MAG: D-tyrosyl-tRNA(Tyr) deacylase [Candidatus Thiodiazotropha sp. (ex Monitilora ramsayi)]|nr:D-tyrosyl-tRNA(Tyr) deacylase [Candidatus Thiodiazotropha sp. (ex Monitilora ramsayi)]